MYVFLYSTTQRFQQEQAICTHYIAKSNNKISLGVIIDNYIDNKLLISNLDKNTSPPILVLTARTLLIFGRQVLINSTCDSTWRAELPLTQSWVLADASARYDGHFRHCCGYCLAQKGYTVVVVAAEGGVEVASGSESEALGDGA